MHIWGAPQPSQHGVHMVPLALVKSLPAGSSDKTVSTWDPRSGLSVQTYYGHCNSVNGVAYTMAGGTIASTDAGAGLERMPM